MMSRSVGVAAMNFNKLCAFSQTSRICENIHIQRALLLANKPESLIWTLTIVWKLISCINPFDALIL